MSDDLTESEALYEKVKARLTAAEQGNIERLRQEREAGNTRNNYGHDLHGAIRQAEFNARTEAAAAYIERVGGNMFTAGIRV